MTVASEQLSSVHSEMFKTLLRTPHRAVDEALVVHQEQFKIDPNFYGKLAVWAVLGGNNVIRDINEVFIAVMFASDFQEHKDAAYVMLQSLPPYQVARVMRYFTGFTETVKHVSISGKPAPTKSATVDVSPARYGGKHPKAGELIPRKKVKVTKDLRSKMGDRIPHGSKEFYVDTFRVKHVGLNRRSVKGALRKAIKNYLRFREQPDNAAILEGALIRARSDVYSLYRLTHTLPGGSEDSWINQFLFKGKIDENNPVSKRLSALTQLSSITDPVKQAEMISDNKLPYTQVLYALKNITPTVLVALIEVMSPQELLSNLSSLKSRGAMDSHDIKELIESKLKKIQKSSKQRIDAMKGAKAAKSVGLPEEIVAAATKATDSQLKFHGQISATTMLMIDKSGSMSSAIELGKELASAIAQACVEGNRPRVFMFDTMPTEIVWRNEDGDITTKSAWDKKLKMFRASGGTEPHNVLRAMISQDIQTEQIVIVTDEGENRAGRFASELKSYEKKFGNIPNIVIARIGSCDVMEKSIKAVGVDVEVLVCTQVDQVSIPNLIQMLSRKSIFDLILEIHNVALPSRLDWDKSHGIAV